MGDMYTTQKQQASVRLYVFNKKSPTWLQGAVFISVGFVCLLLVFFNSFRGPQALQRIRSTQNNSQINYYCLIKEWLGRPVWKISLLTIIARKREVNFTRGLHLEKVNCEMGLLNKWEPLPFELSLATHTDHTANNLAIANWFAAAVWHHKTLWWITHGYALFLSQVVWRVQRSRLCTGRLSGHGAGISGLWSPAPVPALLGASLAPAWPAH